MNCEYWLWSQYFPRKLFAEPSNSVGRCNSIHVRLKYIIHVWLLLGWIEFWVLQVHQKQAGICSLPSKSSLISLVLNCHLLYFSKWAIHSDHSSILCDDSLIAPFSFYVFLNKLQLYNSSSRGIDNMAVRLCLLFWGESTTWGAGDWWGLIRILSLTTNLFQMSTPLNLTQSLSLCPYLREMGSLRVILHLRIKILLCCFRQIVSYLYYACSYLWDRGCCCMSQSKVTSSEQSQISGSIYPLQEQNVQKFYSSL